MAQDELQKLINLIARLPGIGNKSAQRIALYLIKNKQDLMMPLSESIELTAASIKKLEAWLKQDSLNVELLSALGHIAFNANDKQLAEKALAKAIKLGNRREDLALMASITESQDDQKQALQLYKQSMGTD